MDRKITPAYVRATTQEMIDSREVEFIISDSTKDRHRTVLNQDGWSLDNYRKNPIVGYNHDVYGGGLFSKGSPDDIIGTSTISFEEGKMIGRVRFEPAEVNPIADKIFQKVLFGSLRAASVGFSEVGEGKYGEGDEARGKKNETYYFSGQELLEWSIVNIPSNPAAVKRDNYKAPTVWDVVEKYGILAKEFKEDDLRKLDIVEFLKCMEGISTLTLPKRDLESYSVENASRIIQLQKRKIN